MTGAPIRFGLCGTGAWARDIHAAAIAAHPGAQLAGVWGRSPERAGALAEERGTRAFAAVEDLIESVDVVAVALPPDVQAEIAVRAAEAGRHLLLEKPLAFSVDAADRVVDAVRRRQVSALVFHTARFRPEVVRWIDDVRSDGDLHGASATWLASIFQAGSPFGESAWRRERGALWDVGPHALDALLATLGPVDDVVAAAGRGDTVHLILLHASGASSTASVSLTVPPSATVNAAWVYGVGGVSRMPDGPTTALEAYGHAISALLRDVSGSPHPSDVRHGRDIVRILAAAERDLTARRQLPSA